MRYEMTIMRHVFCQCTQYNAVSVHQVQCQYRVPSTTQRRGPCSRPMSDACRHSTCAACATYSESAGSTTVKAHRRLENFKHRIRRGRLALFGDMARMPPKIFAHDAPWNALEVRCVASGATTMQLKWSRSTGSLGIKGPPSLFRFEPSTRSSVTYTVPPVL